MATINRINFFSKSLTMKTDLNVIFSAKFDRDNYKILYLLHGFADDCNSWLTHSMLIDIIDKKSYVVVLPNAFCSFYLNSTQNINDMIAKEIPVFLQKIFNIKHQNAYICGLSMGGFGALKIGLDSSPFGFDGIASLSGSVNLAVREDDLKKVYNDAWTSAILKYLQVAMQNNTDNIDLMKYVKNYEKNLKLFVVCGEKDHLYEMNLDFIAKVKALDKKNITFYSQITPDFAHTWTYWNMQFEKFINWIE